MGAKPSETVTSIVWNITDEGDGYEVRTYFASGDFALILRGQPSEGLGRLPASLRPACPGSSHPPTVRPADGAGACDGVGRTVELDL